MLVFKAAQWLQVSQWPPVLESRIPTRDSPSELCGGLSDTGLVFLPGLPLSSASIILPLLHIHLPSQHRSSHRDNCDKSGNLKQRSFGHRGSPGYKKSSAGMCGEQRRMPRRNSELNPNTPNELHRLFLRAITVGGRVPLILRTLQVPPHGGQNSRLHYKKQTVMLFMGSVRIRCELCARWYCLPAKRRGLKCYSRA
jgi:hypothetical protein